MAKFFIVYFLEICIGLLLITQVLIPIFIPKLKFFWLFTKDEKTQSSNTSLDELKTKSEQNKNARQDLSKSAQEAEATLRDIRNNMAR